MTLRSRLAGAAERLFQRFDSVAKSATYRRVTVGAYDPDSGVAGDTSATVPVKVILESWRQDLIDGELIKAGDRRALIRASELGFEPSADDEITLDGRRWKARGYSADPAGIVYDVHVRAAQ